MTRVDTLSKGGTCEGVTHVDTLSKVAGCSTQHDPQGLICLIVYFPFALECMGGCVV